MEIDGAVSLFGINNLSKHIALVKVVHTVLAGTRV